MTDSSASWLAEQIRQQATSHSLWVCDENYLELMPSTTSQVSAEIQILTNRFDIAQAAKAKGLICTFNDMDISALKNNFDVIFYRISKEKAVCHHVINQAFDYLKSGGQLIICGQKNEGIKTYLEKASALFGQTKIINKDGSNYFSFLTKVDNEKPNYLDSQNYRTFSNLTLPSGISVQTKPGQFGWNKCDEGSQLLVDYLNNTLAPNTPYEHIVDLGCGYGYLSLETRAITANRRTLTDNNAAALMSAERNLAILIESHPNLLTEVIAADAGDQITCKADLLICNPPFHQGFDVSGDLTDKFLLSAARLLLPHGSAYFVVNQFIPIPQKAAHLFKHCEQVDGNKSFALYRLGSPINLPK